MRKKLFAFLYLLVGLLIFAGCGQSAGQEPTGEINLGIEANTSDESSKKDVSKKEGVSSEQSTDQSITDEDNAVENNKDTSTSKEVNNNKNSVAKNDGPLSKLRVHYIDVGQAAATLVEFSDGAESYTLLIDTGNWSSSEVLTYLQSQKINHIDIIAVTHPHADHIGQLDKIINAIQVDEVWMNGETANSQVFARALAAIENNGVDYYEPELGDVFDIGALEVAILHPKSPTGTTNNNSIAMRLQYGGVSFLFTGDGEQQAENDMLNRGSNLQANVLQVGHHGSNTSSSSAFLAKVKPEIAIYSAGSGNQYGHPHKETINRFESIGADLYGTDVHGTIIVETDGTKITVQTNKQGTISRQASTPPKSEGGGTSGKSGSTSSSTSTQKAEPKTEQKVEKKPEPKKETPPATVNACVNINTASEAEVQKIIHIGPERAKDLISLRSYSSVDDLTKIKGIGPARIKDIKEQGIACTGG